MDSMDSCASSIEILMPFAQPNVTQEQYQAFHRIDRMLFVKLVQGLGRSLPESLQVMALLLYIERNAISPTSMVHKILLLPNTLVHAVADEAATCLQCMETDAFLFAPEDEVPLISSLTQNNLSLRHFFDNRTTYLRGITHVVTEVCSRAFLDLAHQAAQQRAAVQHFLVTAAVDAKWQHNHKYEHTQTVAASEMRYSPGGYMPLGYMDPAMEHNHQPMHMGEGDEKVVRAADGRTLFLTFSKGYHVSENEVREFFGWRFGEVSIERIMMQEVAGDEQPLFARLVVGFAEDIGRILEGKHKAKFNINGKHVWARKYVHKTHP